jgi:hypothetical protein
MNQSTMATIQDLKFNASAKITPMVIKNLVDVINSEFERQRTIYDSNKSTAEEKVLEKYKTSIGFNKLLSAYHKAEEAERSATKRKEEAELAINLKGLTTRGDVALEWCGYGTQTDDDIGKDRSVAKLKNLLSTVEIQEPDNLRNKIIARLWVCSTVGEAMVLLREVLGNGIIPTLSKSEVKAITCQ